MALADSSTPGSIMLAGDFTGTASAPQLRITGVVPGTYTNSNVVLDAKGRIVAVSSGTSANLPAATTSTKGAVRIGTNINVLSGVISVPAATTSSQGLVQVGSGIAVASGVMSLSIPDAGTSSKGLVQVGSGMSVVAGVLSNDNANDATTSVKGIVQVGEGLAVSGGLLSLGYSSSTSIVGGVRVIGPYLSVTAGAVDVVTTTVGTYAAALQFQSSQNYQLLTVTPSGTSFTPNLAASKLFSVTLAANSTLNNPTGVVAGDQFDIIVYSNGYALTLGSQYYVASSKSDVKGVSILSCYAQSTTHMHTILQRDFI